MLTTIITVIFGLIGVGALLGAYSIVRNSQQKAMENISEFEKLNAERERRLEEANRRLEASQARLEEYAAELHRRNTLEFRDVASETLQQATRNLRETNSEYLGSVLTPLKTQIESFSSAVRESYVNDNATRKSLSDQIDNLMRLNVSIGEEARNLSSALKGNTRVQGQWGEAVLESLLESVGLIKNVNFFTQTGIKSDDISHAGKRPDVVVLLPDDHRLIIDSKVSLTAYMEFVGANSIEERMRAGKKHLESVKRHIDELCGKEYHSCVENALEHVLMFIPNEGAFFAALELDSDINKYAFDRKVVIVSPTHLYSIIQLVTQLWRQENQNKNAENIAKLGGLLYDKFVAFVSEIENMGSQLELSRRAYDRCLNHLTSGPTSLVNRAERLRQLGAKTNKRISKNLLTEEITTDRSQ